MDLKITVMASLGGNVYFQDGQYYIVIMSSVDAAKMNLLIIVFNFSFHCTLGREFIYEGCCIWRHEVLESKK